MRITPLDVRGHRFAVKMRGYDREEVQSFLNFVSEEFEKDCWPVLGFCTITR